MAANLKDYLVFCDGVHETHVRVLILKLEKLAKNMGVFQDPYFRNEKYGRHGGGMATGVRSEVSDEWGVLDLGDTQVIAISPEGKDDDGLKEMEAEYEPYLYGTYGPKTDL
eukprot:UN13168